MAVPGAYTHITMANRASARPLMESFDIPTPAIVACGKWLKYCELGAVSPDLAYLDFANVAGKRWADAMHHDTTDRPIRYVIEALRDGPGTAAEKEKGLAWLLGYTAHVVMDCTMHPVVNLKVGPYVGHETEHRNCEMHQDAFIYQSLNLGLTTSEHLDSGISRCRGPDGHFDRAIERLWVAALQATYPALIAGGVPKPAEWHRWFTNVVDRIAEGGNLLLALARHISPDSGAIYPTTAQIDLTFIENLSVPGNRRMHFNTLFDKAQGHVCETWRVVARGALGLDEQYKAALNDCNLDTGLGADGQMLFWQGV